MYAFHTCPWLIQRSKEAICLAAAGIGSVLRIERLSMPVDYKVRTLRRLFGPNSFFRPHSAKTRAAAGGKRSKDDGAKQSDGDSDRKGGGRPQAKVLKGGSGVPRAFFNEQLPRAIRNKAVGGQLNIVHLFEKQKMKVYYGALRDQKFKKYVDEARKTRFNTDAALLRLLELRMDTLLYRSGFVQTPMQARQWIAHAQVLVNDEPLTMRSARMRPGDVLSIRESFADNALKAAAATAQTRKELGIGASWIVSRQAAEGMLPWMEIDRAGLSAALVRLPTDDEVRALRNAALFPFIRDAQLNPHAAMRAYR